MQYIQCCEWEVWQARLACTIDLGFIKRPPPLAQIIMVAIDRITPSVDNLQFPPSDEGIQFSRKKNLFTHDDSDSHLSSISAGTHASL